MDINKIKREFSYLLGGGQLENVAEAILKRMNPEWTIVTHPGTIEGTNRSRSHRPVDIWFEDKNGFLIAVQPTAETGEDKLVRDTKKAIQRLRDCNRLSHASVALFLNHDPDIMVLEKCKHICGADKVSFFHYTNSKVAEFLVKPVNWDLCRDQLGLEVPKETDLPFIRLEHPSGNGNRLLDDKLRIKNLGNGLILSFNMTVKRLYGNDVIATASYSDKSPLSKDDSNRFVYLSQLPRVASRQATDPNLDKMIIEIDYTDVRSTVFKRVFEYKFTSFWDYYGNASVVINDITNEIDV